jgi:hypothetical protein
MGNRTSSSGADIKAQVPPEYKKRAGAPVHCSACGDSDNTAIHRVLCSRSSKGTNLQLYSSRKSTILSNGQWAQYMFVYLDGVDLLRLGYTCKSNRRCIYHTKNTPLHRLQQNIAGFGLTGFCNLLSANGAVLGASSFVLGSIVCSSHKLWSDVADVDVSVKTPQGLSVLRDYLVKEGYAIDRQLSLSNRAVLRAPGRITIDIVNNLSMKTNHSVEPSVH